MKKKKFGPKFGPRYYCARSSIRKKKPGTERIRRPHGLNEHHLLFQEKHWRNGWAYKLRNHPYMRKLIPQGTLHAIIHSKIHDVPCPNASECKLAYLTIEERIGGGSIDVEHDTIEQRLDLLIELWKDKCPATVAVLYWQRDVVEKFYAKQAEKKAAREAKAKQVPVVPKKSRLKKRPQKIRFGHAS